jgi:hypothetical protein
MVLASQKKRRDFFWMARVQETACLIARAKVRFHTGLGNRKMASLCYVMCKELT